jgi:glycosyltransferase involved in cell wall biosynthesis
MASALIVFNDPSRIENLQQALACFAQQTWPYKECLIINSTGIAIGAPGVRVIDIKAKYLGELKNLALYNALGEWCFPWPDDCEFAPDYINWHMHRRSKQQPTVISNPLGAVLKDGIVHTLDWEAAPCASFFRFGPHIYDSDGSDVRFLEKYAEKNFAEAEGGLVTRFFSDYAS